jgi:hypothetical protein
VILPPFSIPCLVGSPFITNSLTHEQIGVKDIQSCGTCTHWVQDPVHLYEMQINQAKSAARFGRQVAAWVPDMFCNFYLLKNQEIADTSRTTEARDKNKHIFGIVRI